MENPGIEQLDTASKPSDNIRNSLTAIVAAALLMAASPAMAGIIFVPVGNHYTAPETAPVNVQHLDGETFRFRTSGLAGEWIIDGGDLPPENAFPAAAQAVLPFIQDLELVVDIGGETASDPLIMRKFADAASVYLVIIKEMDEASTLMITTTEFRGNASCVPRNGFDCGQLVVHLEMQGFITNSSDPACIGMLRTELLGSLVWDGVAAAHWTSLTASARLEGAGGLIGTIISMEEGESCGV